MMPELVETLREAQRLGFLGARPVEMAVRHSTAFTTAIGELPNGARLVDLGSGGGLPGLVLAASYPHALVTLVERRQTRADFLERARRRHRWSHVKVRAVDVAAVVREVASGVCDPFDVATARGFGPPVTTLRTGLALVVEGGRVVISEPPSGDRWPPDLLAELGVRGERRGAVRVFSAG